MSTPYRIAGAVEEPADRVETLRLRRFPLVAQLAILGWFPAAMLFAAQTIPKTTLACERASAGAHASCRLEERTLFGSEAQAVEPDAANVRAVAQGKGSALVVRAETKENVLAVHRAPAAEANARFGTFVAAREAGQLRLVLRDATHAYLALTLMEVVAIALLVFAQRRIRIDVNADAGRLRIEERRLLRAPLIRDLDLHHVQGFQLDELSDNEKTQHVTAMMVSGRRRRLFDAMPSEARRGAAFLASQLEAWGEREGAATRFAYVPRACDGEREDPVAAEELDALVVRGG